MKSKYILSLLSLVAGVGLLAGCGGTGSSGNNPGGQDFAADDVQTITNGICTVKVKVQAHGYASLLPQINLVATTPTAYSVCSFSLHANSMNGESGPTLNVNHTEGSNNAVMVPVSSLNWGVPYYLTVCAQIASRNGVKAGSGNDTCATTLFGPTLTTINQPQWAWIGGSQSTDMPPNFNLPNTNPGGRWGNVSLSIPHSNNLITFGGYVESGSSDNVYNDMWYANISLESSQFTNMVEWSNVGYELNTPLSVPQGYVNSPGVYFPNTARTVYPSSRSYGAIWLGTQEFGSYYVFGGYGYDSYGKLGYLNDTWSFDFTGNNYRNGFWQHVRGPGYANATGVYSGRDSIPGARSGSAFWQDESGTLWMFGGYGYGAESSGPGYLNDLWKFNQQDDSWTYVAGSSSIDQLGKYGTKGEISASNWPGSRQYANVVVSPHGDKFWLFGGVGYGASGGQGNLNDLWQYDVKTGQWTWISGSQQVNQPSVFGELGVASANNVPGARAEISGWVDLEGNLWIFGGATNNNNDVLNDFWYYNTRYGTWTWMGGSQSTDAVGVYGTLGVLNANNAPGARAGQVVWTGTGFSNIVVMYGGVGQGATVSPGARSLNDVWYITTPTPVAATP